MIKGLYPYYMYHQQIRCPKDIRDSMAFAFLIVLQVILYKLSEKFLPLLYLIQNRATFYFPQ